MTPLEDRRLIDRFIRTLPLRHPSSRRVYRCILGRFQRFVVRQAAPAQVSSDTVRRWVIARRAEWPEPLVYHRACLVDRFLEWLVGSGILATNPFAEWRREYGQRTTTPIVRALLSPNPTAALAALRPLPAFGSWLGDVMRAHVTHMQSLGFRYQTAAEQLLRFDRFLQHHPELIGQPLRVLIGTWAKAGPSLQHQWVAQACGRAISTALRRLDGTTDVLRIDPLLERRIRQQHRRPYLYTAADLQRILEAARTFPSPLAPLRTLSLHLMVVLAICAGLRLGELAGLTLGDVDLKDGTIEIRETKFFKSRRLPLARSVITVLHRYLEARRQAGAPTEPSAGLFWHHHRAGPYSRVMIQTLLTRVLQRAGLKPPSGAGRTGPRVHDLRHAFVLHRMLTWYRTGINPQPRLPFLAAYLGHKDINSTIVYLTVTQELLQQANERFRQHSSRVLRPEGGRP
jgi:integrase/recombinase XerD